MNRGIFIFALPLVMSVCAYAAPSDAQARFDSMPLDTLTILATNQDAQAQFYLGKRLQATGEFTSARYWYGRAADNNLAPAMLNLGVMLFKGQGGAIDEAKARAYLEKATQLGDNRASYVLAMIDERSKKFIEAYKWYHLSARQGMLDDKVRNMAKKSYRELGCQSII